MSRDFSRLVFGQCARRAYGCGVKIPDSSGSVKGAASELVRRLRAGRAGRQSGYIDGKELLAAGI